MKKFPSPRSTQMLKIFSFCSFRNFGFTLLEMIVAVGILSVVVVFALSTIWRGTTLGAYATDEMTASYLAQDAMEYIRAKKNENITNGVAWLTGFPPQCTDSSSQTCRVDTVNDAIAVCNGTGCLLSYNATSYIYGYGVPAGTWTPTRFTRSVDMHEIEPNQEVRVTVTVSFRQGALTKTTRFDQNMYNVI